MAVDRRTSRDIRSESRLTVMRTLLAAGESTRNRLAEDTGLSVGTVSTVVSDLLKHGIITETGQFGGLIGRPTTGLRTNADRGRVVAVYVDVEEAYLAAKVYDAELGELALAEATIEGRLEDADTVIDAIERVLCAALDRARTNRDDVLGVGILLPGGMRRPVKEAVAVPNPIWLHLDRLRDRLRLPVVVENPLKARATAELWLGAGRRCANLVTVTLGIGVGAGIVQDGVLTRGSSDSAGEWGHTLFTFDGRLCRCGRRGCVEAYLGVDGIRQTLAEIAPEHPLTAEAGRRRFLEALGELPDREATDTVERTAHYLGAALTDLVALVNPEVITLSGWTARFLCEHMLPIVRLRVVEESPGDAAADLAIEISSIHDPGMAGIAAVALERFMRDVGLVTTKMLPAI